MGRVPQNIIMVKYTTGCGREWPHMAGKGGDILLEGAKTHAPLTFLLERSLTNEVPMAVLP